MTLDSPRYDNTLNNPIQPKQLNFEGPSPDEKLKKEMDNLRNEMEQSKVKKIQVVQKYFDKFEDQPKKQKEHLKMFWNRLNKSPEVRKENAKIIYKQCMDAVKKYEYNFKDRPSHLIDLLDTFIWKLVETVKVEVGKRGGLTYITYPQAPGDFSNPNYA